MTNTILLLAITYAVLFLGLLDDLHHMRHPNPVAWTLAGVALGCGCVGVTTIFGIN
jgi:hypothetical protein